MGLWLALLVPVIVTTIVYIFWNHRITLAELGIPFVATFFAILGSYYFMKEVRMHDVEYNGELVVEARYYEYWSTWVPRTCYTTVSCGKNCTMQVPYDCSYCDENSPYWEAVLANGKVIRITESHYNRIVKKFKKTPTFYEMNRSIRTNWRCGKDGDMYYVKWDGKIATSEAATWKVEFQNPVKASHSAFQYPDMSDTTASLLGLYKYPEFYDGTRQQAILSHNFNFSEEDHQQLEYINGLLGPKNKVKTFTLLFLDKPVSTALQQEQYWEGGNQNEIVTCIGVDKQLNIKWVQVFSWCDNKMIHVTMRDDITNLGKFSAKNIAALYYKNIPKYFHYKSFKDFNYLTFDPTFKQIVWVWVIALFISIGCSWFIVANDLNPDEYYQYKRFF